MRNRHLGRLLVGVALLAGACSGAGDIQADQAAVEVSVVDGSTVPEQPAADEGGDETTTSGETNDTTAGDTTAAAGDSAAPAGTPTGSPGAPITECDGGAASTYQPEAPTNPATPETLELNQPITGEIEQFTVDNWKLDLCAGQLIFFESLDGCSGSAGLEWYLITPDGDSREYLGRLIDDTTDCGRDIGPKEILESGQYTLELTYPGAADESGTYAIQVLNVPLPDIFEVEIGTEITPGSPEGAGTIEALGSADHYKLTLEAGQRFFLDVAAECSGTGFVEWYLISPEADSTYIGRIISGDKCSDDPDPIVVDQAGTYTIRVAYPDNDNTFGATYGFTIVDASGGG